MCLTTNKSLRKPIKEMIGWKLLRYGNDQYYTPFQKNIIKKNQIFLTATGKKTIERYKNLYDIHQIEYHGGYIHCYTTRAIARANSHDLKVIKVKCYNVRAIGVNGDLVCDKIKFLWNEKT